MTTDEVRAFLAAVARRPTTSSVEEVRAVLAQYKRDALTRGDQDEAKGLGAWKPRFWPKTNTSRRLATSNNARSIRHGVNSKMQNAPWPTSNGTRRPHGIGFRLDFLKTYTANWQSLFPYRMFFSPEILKKETACSICQRPVLPQTFCGHRVGEIYKGELCHRIIKRVEVLGIGMVNKPAQKYSVLFLSDNNGGIKDQYNYALVEFAISALRNPFDKWDVERTTRRQPHSRYAHVGRNDPCPCERGKKYKHCCLRETGVLRPHFQFTFAKQPPENVDLEERFID